MNKKILYLLSTLIILFLPFVFAETASLDTTLDSSDKAQFDAILTPVMKIYNFVKYIASVVAAIALLWAGISYMVSGNDPRKREESKNIAMYVIIGLVIIWAAPMIVQLLI